MYYVCIDNQEKRISSILEYEPNVLAHVKVVNITSEEYTCIENRTHYFSIEENKVVVVPQTYQNTLNEEKVKAEAKLLLSNTDWKVLRHFREKALQVETSLTEDEYLELESQRAQAASII